MRHILKRSCLFRRCCRGARAARRGTILFVAIGAVAVLSILTLGTTSSVMQEMKLARAVTRANESFYAGMAAVEIARIVVTRDDTPGVITLYDLRGRDVAFADKTLKIRLYDEEGLVPLAQATADVLTRLPGLEETSVASNVAAADIAVKEDAFFVSGVDPEMYAQFAPHVTTHSHGRININTAGSVVLQALGMDEDLVAKVREFRAGTDGEEGTIDDAFFSSEAAIVPSLRDGAQISDAEAAFVGDLVARGLLSTSSAYIRVESVLVTGTREEPAVQAVVYVPTGNVVAWYEE